MTEQIAIAAQPTAARAGAPTVRHGARPHAVEPPVAAGAPLAAGSHHSALPSPLCGHMADWLGRALNGAAS